MSAALRSRPRLAIIDARAHPVAALKGCQRLKADSFTGIVPALVWVRNDATSFAAAFDVQADEVVREGTESVEVSLRLEALLRRSDRDTYVHPSTRLPGGVEIETDILRRLEADEFFAACYADLDHFKEYNDRYSYYDGDRVIRILSKIDTISLHTSCTLSAGMTKRKSSPPICPTNPCSATVPFTTSCRIFDKMRMTRSPS